MYHRDDLFLGQCQEGETDEPATHLKIGVYLEEENCNLSIKQDFVIIKVEYAFV